MPRIDLSALAWVGATLATSFAAGPANSVPPPPEQLHADCASPTYASDQLICSDPQLTAMDRQMAADLLSTGQAAIEPASPFIEAQADWIRRRSLCAMRSDHALCLEHAYDERIAVLAALGARSDQPIAIYKCDGSEGEGRLTAEVLPNGSARLLSGSEVLAVGTPQLAGKRWEPFAIVNVARQSNITFSLPGDRRVQCQEVRGLK
jgi:uncharacterized protein